MRLIRILADHRRALMAAAVVAGLFTAAILVARAQGRSVARHPSLAAPSPGVPRAEAAAESESLPGAPAFPAELTARLRARWAQRSPSYAPRTRHLRPD